ncbi:HAMP domain-containing histidine kinase [Alsobacter sp. SYSU M60028]|uniref:Signal transduction histidine-protein kinase/phosphatase MprB n=2 Tax=Alsobacter ponti TaxID=2962936 RepID=A0ABT1LIN0_9HYPH|nr:HAMP domain-containing histidine kinase [Alsobacter ponti]
MVAEVLIYVPSIANFRRNWLNDRIAAAQIAALVLEAAPAGAVPEELQRRLLDQIGASSVAVRSGGARRLLAVTDLPHSVERMVDLREASPWVWIVDAFGALTGPEHTMLRIVGPGMDGVEFVEIVLDEAPLRSAMWRYSANVLLLSLVISIVTALLVYRALHVMIVRPVRRLTSSIMAFGRRPEDAGPVIRPSGRDDEIGQAEDALAAMQKSLADELRQKKHLAALGLAVSKINHDLRNMLASAQLFSDRISGISEPTVQRFAPKLIGALDRAIGFCESTLAYGRAAERPPERRAVPLAPMVEDLRDLLGLWDDSDIALVNDVPDGLTADADPEHLFRVLLNLGRNAVQALRDHAAENPDAPRRIAVSARRDGSATVIEVADTGPGVPARVRERLFEAFLGSNRRGGSGLGLAIAAELVHAHGGTISLEPTETGSLFRVVIPDSELV